MDTVSFFGGASQLKSTAALHADISPTLNAIVVGIEAQTFRLNATNVSLAVHTHGKCQGDRHQKSRFCNFGLVWSESECGLDVLLGEKKCVCVCVPILWQPLALHLSTVPAHRPHTSHLEGTIGF